MDEAFISTVSCLPVLPRELSVFLHHGVLVSGTPLQWDLHKCLEWCAGKTFARCVLNFINLNLWFYTESRFSQWPKSDMLSVQTFVRTAREAGMKVAWQIRTERNGIQLLILGISVSETFSIILIITGWFYIPHIWGHLTVSLCFLKQLLMKRIYSKF